VHCRSRFSKKASDKKKGGRRKSTRHMLDEAYVEKLKRDKEKAMEKYQQLAGKIKAEVHSNRKVIVSAVFVSFNTAAARDKVSPQGIEPNAFPMRC
jgi:hypothetical protein